MFELTEAPIELGVRAELHRPGRREPVRRGPSRPSARCSASRTSPNVAGELVASIERRAVVAMLRGQEAPRCEALSGLLAGGVASLIGLVALLYFTSAHFQAGTSDQATGDPRGSGHRPRGGFSSRVNLTSASYWTSNAVFDGPPSSSAAFGRRCCTPHLLSQAPLPSPSGCSSLVRVAAVGRVLPEGWPWLPFSLLPRQPWASSLSAVVSTSARRCMRSWRSSP